MKPIALDIQHNSTTSLYIQLYDHLRQAIIQGEITAGERLPSLRRLAKDLGISVTTVSQAYDQLVVEGYLTSRPHSGYYAADLKVAGQIPETLETLITEPIDFDTDQIQKTEYRYDTASFDFVKWKKCLSAVLNEHAHLLLSESDPQGEPALRHEIARYVYTARGVLCAPEQVVIAAGTQQLTGHLIRILRKMRIDHISTEDPGYLPVQNIFRDHEFSITRIPVRQDGILIERLPMNIASAVYLSPSNQFPTGSVMPVGRRYQLLEWAEANDSLILEDDYDSELRYFGKPIPPLASLDKAGRVVYFGSFSSTLFPAIKISYIILPKAMAKIFSRIKRDYDQTCSKEEQLALAMFMEKGYYYTNIKKLRSLCAQKLQAALTALSEYATGFVTPMNTHSGINLTLRVQTYIAPDELCRRAAELGLYLVPVASLTDQTTAELIFYYNRVPIGDIGPCVKAMIDAWR
ncbi:PLP-dependent aminotransferase family protein [Eubacterium sp. AB3007]|uniref:MocR-like pyridoxine biosynthesis transcription factor PdxR n=1 Tax=Eubacterium sp. AB3007 TaxID=1392487 RepID=UPI0004898758|nr:PLP-dependent aminotransferase family protein [Eubacterium sp. AB3007]